MADVRLENVSKKFGNVEAVAAFSEIIREGEFVSLLGPSGCGKTTTLRIIAGFERATTGRVFIGTELVSCSETRTYKPPEQRNIGMVFQSYAVWPHMNVFANVAYPLKVRGTSKKTIREKVGTFSTSCTWRASRSVCPASSPGGSSSAWPWPGHSWPSPPFFFWTSLSPTWTPSSARACASRSRTCSAASGSPSST